MTREDAAAIAMENLSELLHHADIVRISYEYDTPDTITVVATDAAALASDQKYMPARLLVEDGGQKFDFSVATATGAKVVPAVGGPDDVPIRTLELPAQGGDPCFVTGAGSWGTAGVFFRSLTIQVDCPGKSYAVSAADGFLSNNHVIADLDALPPGTALTASTRLGQPALATASLAGFIPTSDSFVMLDVAAGTGLTPPNYLWAVRGLGPPNPAFRNPADSGESITKSGARTGVTAGATTGRSIIRAPGAGGIRWYNGIYSTTPNFHDHGDSGSIVLGNNNDIVGMATWIDDTTKVGYFFTFAEQWRPFRKNLTKISISIA